MFSLAFLPVLNSEDFGKVWTWTAPAARCTICTESFIACAYFLMQRHSDTCVQQQHHHHHHLQQQRQQGRRTRGASSSLCKHLLSLIAKKFPSGRKATVVLILISWCLIWSRGFLLAAAISEGGGNIASTVGSSRTTQSCWCSEAGKCSHARSEWEVQNEILQNVPSQSGAAATHSLSWLFQ